MLTARFRFLGLWLSQTSRALADSCLLTFVALLVARFGALSLDASWQAVHFCFLFPFLLLAPLTGAVSNSLPRQWVLVVSAGFCLGIVLIGEAWLGTSGEPWFWCGLVACNGIGAAVYSATRYALLPAAAEDVHRPLSRLTAWIEMGRAAAAVAGVVLGWHLGPSPAAGATVAALNLVGLLTALPVGFPSDMCRPERPARALDGFFRDGGRIVRDRETRATLLGLTACMGLLAAVVGVVLGSQAAPLRPLGYLLAGAAAGAVLAGLQGNLRRGLGLVPLGTAGLVGALVWAAGASEPGGPCLLLGVLGGLIQVPLRANYLAALPADARGNGTAILNAANGLAVLALGLLGFELARRQMIRPAGLFGLLAGLAAVGLVVAWSSLLREALEQVLESLSWPFYRVRVYGPGLAQLPRRGPLLVVANHSAWFDPLWLGKVFPRRLTPLMTSKFYDLPVLHWLMTRVVGAIRVPVSRFRRQAPELEDAVAALDRSECVLIFPEGSMRRRAEQPLRRFGQGIWHILRQRPGTPVVACWIEGGWGSLTSYAGGLPLKNKRPDWWRRIGIGIAPPQIIPPSLLADHLITREYLRHACLDARRYLGLAPLAEAKSAADDAAASAGEEEE